MITVQKIDTQSKAQVRRFTDIPFRLYTGHPQWVPPLLMDVRTMLNRQKHPFYEHSAADFFVAVRDGRDVGRIAALENTRFNATGLDHVVGPKGFGVLDGYGLLVEGYEHRQMMTMMNYNYEYYPRLVEALGFEKEVDFVSCYIKAEDFRLPERIHRIAERVKRRGSLSVKRFRTKRELIKWTGRIGVTYNRAFVDNWEYYPLTEREIDFLVSNLVTVANPRLIKIITHGEDVVGFLFGFPDVSAALQRARGCLTPWGLADLLLELRRTQWVAINGAGILPEFQGRGGNTLLYTEMENTIREFGYQHADLTQVAETAVQMRSDLVNLGGKPYKNHRVYVRGI